MTWFLNWIYIPFSTYNTYSHSILIFYRLLLLMLPSLLLFLLLLLLLLLLMQLLLLLLLRVYLFPPPPPCPSTSGASSKVASPSLFQGFSIFSQNFFTFFVVFKFQSSFFSSWSYFHPFFIFWPQKSPPREIGVDTATFREDAAPGHVTSRIPTCTRSRIPTCADATQYNFLYR